MPNGSIRLALSPAVRQGLARLAREYGCDPEAVAVVAIEEMIAAHRPAPKPTPVASGSKTPAPPKPAVTRAYQQKPCATCQKTFAPSGPRSAVCDACKASFAADAPRAPRAPRLPVNPEYETVWNGAMGGRAQ